MIESWPESKRGEHEKFDVFRTAVQTQCTDVRFAWIGGDLLVVGTVRSYALKANIDAEAKNCGIEVQNCVRVVPGREWFVPETFRLAG